MKEILILVAVFLASLALVRLYGKQATRMGILDRPNERSAHQRATPRGGGLVVVSLWMLTCILLAAAGLVPSSIIKCLILPGLLVATVGYLDDLRGLSARSRALCHLLAAAICLGSIGGMPSITIGAHALSLGWLGGMVALLAIAWSINLYNFMDGMDGLAGTQALVIFATGGAFLWDATAHGLAIAAWAAAASVAGFLWWNRPPARVFMGDVGSGWLGFLVAAFAVIGEIQYKVPVLLWMILYSAFLLDATVTLLRRIFRGEAWYVAHRSHAYQRLHHQGKWSHGAVLRSMLFLDLILAGMAAIAHRWPVALPWMAVFALILNGAVLIAIEIMAPMVGTPNTEPTNSANPNPAGRG